MGGWGPKTWRGIFFRGKITLFNFGKVKEKICLFSKVVSSFTGVHKKKEKNNVTGFRSAL